MTRRWLFENTHNIRDLGGYATLAGGETRWGVFLRSDEPVTLSLGEVARLRRHSITTVVDLRSVQEQEHRPCFLAGQEGFVYHHCPLNFVGKLPEQSHDMAAFYMAMLGDSATVCRIIKAFAKASGGVLFHCAAGKDRTGIMAALLLALAGVPQNDIVADYQITHTYIQEMVRRFQKAGTSFPAWLGESRPEYMEGFLALFYEKFSSAEAFYLAIGVTQEEIDCIRTKFVCPERE